MNIGLGAKLALSVLLLALFLVGCADETESPVRLALLAPFEGRYREIGYDAYYAAQLALQDAGRADIEFLPVDDGGSPETAVDRARALARDPLVRAVIVLGYDATGEDVQRAFGDLPVIIVGHWLVEPQSDHIFALTSPAIPDEMTTTERISITEAAQVEAPFVGGEVFALRGLRNLRADLTGITVVSAGLLPSDDFRQRILDSFEFSVEPGILAMSVYDVFRIVMLIPTKHPTRTDIQHTLATTDYRSYTGPIRFEHQYWANAPTNYYVFDPSQELTKNTIEVR